MFDLPPVALDRDALRRQLLSIQRKDSLVYEHAGRRFFAPRSIDELTALRAAHPQATILAGNTDVGLWVTKQLRELPEIICIGGVDELKAIREAGGVLRIGAGQRCRGLGRWRGTIGSRRDGDTSRQNRSATRRRWAATSRTGHRSAIRCGLIALGAP
jgi:hypothetical protein